MLSYFGIPNRIYPIKRDIQYELPLALRSSWPVANRFLRTSFII